MPSCSLPHFYILIGGTCGKGIKIQAAITALDTLESFWWHVMFLLPEWIWFCPYTHTMPLIPLKAVLRADCLNRNGNYAVTLETIKSVSQQP